MTFLKIRNKAKDIKHYAENVYVDYRPGLEKAVYDEVRAEIHRLVKEFNWAKEGVTFHIEKVLKHPLLDPGYVFEIQLNGDGLSYTDIILERFKSPQCKIVWIKLTKENWAFIEYRAGSLETSWDTLDEPIDEEVISYEEDRNIKTKRFYYDSYMFFYVSLWLMILAALSLPLAAIFKYVLLDEEKTFLNKSNYTPNKYLPVETVMRLSNERSLNSRPLAVHYTPGKGWYVVFEEKTENGASLYERKIDMNGQFMDASELIPEIKNKELNN